jgi:hypothetical protein
MKLLFAVLTLSLLPGCPLTSSEMSCSLKNKQTGMTERCVEYSDFAVATSVNAKASLQILCNLFQAEIEDKLCDTSGALAGCKKVDGAWTQIDFRWPSTSVKAPGDVDCNTNDTRVGPDRQPIMGGGGGDMKMSSNCTPASSSPAVTITFKNNTAGPVSTYWVNPSCTQMYYQTINAGQSTMQATFVGHVWRIREGAQNATGNVVKEFAPQAADAPAVTVNIP